MTWAPETDKRPRLVPVREIGEGYDAAIDGMPLILDYSGEGGFYNSLGSQDAAGYEVQSEEIGIQQTSTSDDIAENKLNENEFWRSMRDFRGGLGQKRIDVPKVSDDRAYWESYRVDARKPGALSLARKTAIAAPATYSTTLWSSSQASDGFWFISQSGSGSTMAVTHYDFTTFTTKTLSTISWFRDVEVGPDDKCWIGGDNGLYYVTKAGSITAWTSTAYQVRRVCAAKQRLFLGAFFNTDNVYSFWEIESTGTPPVTPTKKLQFAPGIQPSDIKEAGALILIAANPFNWELGSSFITGAGQLFAYDGVNAPTVVLVLPPGEQITCIHPALGGSVVLLFVRRLEANGNVRGVIYVADVQGTTFGNVRIAFEYPDGYSQFYVHEAVGIGNQVYFAGAYDASRGVGRGIDAYNLAEGTVSHYGTAPTADSTDFYQLTSYQGRLVWGQLQSAAAKLVIESNTDYDANGQLDTSVLDLNVDAPKNWTKVEAGCQPLATGQKIDLYWTADDPASTSAIWTLLGTMHPGMSSLIVPLGVLSAKLALRAKLYGTATTTPTLTKLGASAVMARPPGLVHHLKALAFAQMDKLNGDPFEHAGEDYWFRLSQRLEALRATGRPAWLQTPSSRFDGHVHRVRVGSMVRRILNNPGKGWGGLIAFRASNIEPDRRNLLPLAVASFGAVPTNLAVGSVFEVIGSGVSLSFDTSVISWSTQQLGVVKVTPDSVGDGIRGPAPHLQVPWDARNREGHPISASILVRPYVDNMRFDLHVEAYDTFDGIVQTDGPSNIQLGAGTAGQWVPIFLEDFDYDAFVFSGLVFPTVKVTLAAGSAVGAFAVDAAQLEQAFIATPWVPPPTNL